MSQKMSLTLLSLAFLSLPWLVGCEASMTEPEAVAHVATQMEEMKAKMEKEFSKDKKFSDKKEEEKYKTKMMESTRDALRSIKVSQCPKEFQDAWKEYVKNMDQVFDLTKEMSKMAAMSADDKASQEKGMEMFGKIMAAGIAVATWKAAWERFTPFLAFPPELRRVIYTTNSIESLNYQLRKVSKNRGHFPNDTAALKLLWLAICNIEDKRARDRAKERGKPTGQRKAQGRLVEGQVTTNWKQALAQLALAYPERINPYLTY